MERDISIFVDRNILFGDISSLIRKTGRKILENVTLIDVFDTNKSDPKVSLTFRLRYRKKDSTLTEEEIQPVHQKIITNLETKFLAEQRK